MTPDQLEEYSRQRYNAVNDTFWSSTEIMSYITAASNDLARDTFVIERTYETTTVSGTQGYDYPTNAKDIKRVTWNGVKLIPIDMRLDDAMTGMNMATTDTGNPESYFIWNRTIYLRPIPGSAATLKLWTHNYPSTVSSTSTLEVPDEYHYDLADCVNMHMALKDQNFTAATYYGQLWEKKKSDIRKDMRRKKRADGFATVKDENYVIIESVIP